MERYNLIYDTFNLVLVDIVNAYKDNDYKEVVIQLRINSEIGQYKQTMVLNLAWVKNNYWLVASKANNFFMGEYVIENDKACCYDNEFHSEICHVRIDRKNIVRFYNGRVRSYNINSLNSVDVVNKFKKHCLIRYFGILIHKLCELMKKSKLPIEIISKIFRYCDFPVND